MILKQNEIVHIILRRILESDLRRHFLGVVKDILPTAIRVEGYYYIFDNVKNTYIKKLEKRTKIFALNDNLIIINVLPNYLVFDDLEYSLKNNAFYIEDNLGFSLEITE